jgi:hypothetical protein
MAVEMESGRRGKGGRARDPARGQRGAALFAVLATGIVLALVLSFVLFRSGLNRKESVKNMAATREFYLADAGFNYIKTKVTIANRDGGAKRVGAFLASQRSAGWQPIDLGGTGMGYFRLKDYKLVETPLTAELEVQGSRDAGDAPVHETVQGVLRVPSLARYARYVEGSTPLVYTSGTVVAGEILAAGRITLTGPTVHFTRLVSTGEVIANRPAGRYDFGFRENQKDIPTLNHVHVNSLDNYRYDGSKYASTFQYHAEHGGIHVFGPGDPGGIPSWSGLNGTSRCSAPNASGPCDTLFAGCYDTLSLARRSPVVVAGSAVAIDLSRITVAGGEVRVVVQPVVWDAGGDGKDYFTLGTPARTYRRPLSTFAANAIIYFPGDIYVTGKLRGIPVTIASGDDIFLHGDFVGPERTELDENRMPVTLGLVAQDRVYIHEASSRDFTLRAAVLAENDEIIYEAQGYRTPWHHGYVCRREIFDSAPAKGATVEFAAFFRDNFIWDDGRVRQAGFGREPEEECKADGTCPNRVLEAYGFAALAFPRTEGARWKLTFEGSLITREPGSKGPKDDCGLGWDCDAEPDRTVWAYDDNLGVAYPPKFPAPVMDDRNPTTIVGFKRKSYE